MTITDSIVEEIFFAALEKKSQAEVAAYLDEVCEKNAPLRRRVQRLLDARPKLGDFLNQQTVQGDSTIEQPICEMRGMQIGPYKLREQIGEGGFGVVYVAEQSEPVHRKVALKIIKPGMDTKEVIARFEAERQALALMDHPNVAKVLEAGATDSGHPYFAMELVKGVPITRFCVEGELSTRQRLELFIDVCRAVQHAHQKGIIHRDLKPSNVLVTLHDQKPVVKVIDFGISKALKTRLTEKSIYTAYGQMIGTPLYMSPEQAQMNAIDVDTRSDVYSLGVLMYELLTGTTPFEKETLKNIGFDELRRIIREDDPPRPSARVSTLNAGSLPTASQQRRIDARKLSRLLRGELDWIVMKALEKDRNRRYESASAFAADVDRYLNDEPVQACPPSLRQRLVKWSYRNRTIVFATASSAAIVLLTAVGLLAFSHARIREAYEGQVKALGQAKESLAREEAELYFHRIALAQRELQNNFVRRARPLLEACPPERKGWEHAYLEGICDRSVRTFRGHVGRVQDVAFSPEGTRVASAGYDGTVRVWNTATGQDVLILRRHDGVVGCVAFSPDGRLIVSGGPDGTVRVWDTASGEEIGTLGEGSHPSHQGAVAGVAFSPNGRWIATASDDRTVRLWETGTRRLLATLAGHNENVYGVAFHPDGNQLVSSAHDKTICLWDLREIDGESVMVLEPSHTLTGHELGVMSVTFDPQGERIASGSFDNTIKLWNAESGRELLTIRGHKHWVSSVAFDAAGERIVSACGDGCCMIWDASTGKELNTLRGHIAPTMGAAFSPVDDLVISASWDGSLKLWDPNTAVDERTLSGHKRLITDVAIDRDGRWIASASFDGTVAIWNAETGLRQQVLDHDPSQVDTPVVWTVAFTPDGQVVTGSSDKKVRIWDMGTGKLVEEIEYPLQVFDVAISPDGRLMVAGCGQHSLLHLIEPTKPLPVEPLTVRNPETNQIQALKGPTRDVLSVAFSPDGRWIAASSRDGICRVWEHRTGRLVTKFHGHSGEWITSICFSPDGKQVLSCCVFNPAFDPGEIKLWNAQTGEETLTFVEDSAPCRMAKFSPDGRRIVAASFGTALILIDAESGREILSLDGHKRETWCTVFSPDGRRIISGSWDFTLKVWEAPGFRPRPLD